MLFLPRVVVFFGCFAFLDRRIVLHLWIGVLSGWFASKGKGYTRFAVRGLSRSSGVLDCKVDLRTVVGGCWRRKVCESFHFQSAIPGARKQH